MIVLPDIKDLTMVSSFIWAKHRNVTDGRTDGRTERQTDGQTARIYYNGLHCEQCGRAVKMR